MFGEMDKRSSLQIDTILSYSKKGLLSQTSFTSVEDSYRNVLRELSSRKDMDGIAAEYRHMYEEVQRLRNTQEELIKKNTALQSKMVEKVKELEVIQTDSKVDKELINQLKEEAKRDYKAIYSEVCEEQGLKELIENLWPQMLKLNKELEEMARFHPEKLESPSRMFQFNEMKEKLLKERHVLYQVATALKKKLNIAKQTSFALEARSSATEMKARKLMADLESENQKIAALQKEQKFLEERKIAALKEVHIIETEYNAFNDKIKDACLKIQQLEDSTKDMESTHDKTKSDMEQLRHILRTYHAEYKTLIDNLKSLGRIFISNTSQHGDAT